MAGELGGLCKRWNGWTKWLRAWFPRMSRLRAHGTNCRLALRRYADSVEVDPARLTQLEQRLDAIRSLRRKYGASVADVIAFGAGAESEAAST